MSWFHRKTPPPPFYKKNPVATAALFLTFVAMFVLGPIGAVYQGLTEDLKAKANNETILLYMKQQQITDERQWKAIEQQIQRPTSIQVEKPPLSPAEYQQYMKMSPADRAGFRALHPSYQSLPQ